jgi:broad specificity phosphatase PhoE
MKKYFVASIDQITRLILIRHGQTASNEGGRILGTADIPLDEVGITQAMALSKRIADFQVGKIYSSPLSRARETAQAMNKLSCVNIEFRAELIEYDHGIISNLTLDELARQDDRLYAEILSWLEEGSENGDLPRPVVPGAESVYALQERAQDFINHILSCHKGEVIAAVSHAGFIKALLTCIVGGSMDRHLPFGINNASISVVDFYKGVPTIRLINDICHLENEKLTYGRPLIL